MRAFVDVCLAVEFAHSRGIIHRDLKPANIMLGDFGEVYVLDWGIARAVTEVDDSGATPRPSLRDLKLDTGDTAAGTVMGTPAYAAPEQLVGERAGPAADIYALGCLLYEIVAGELLHKRRDLASVAIAVDARPSSQRTDAPPELDAVCTTATAIEPGQRHATARALGDAVQAFLDGDRDVAVRKELAVGHVHEARAALARGNSEADRRAAMREAGRALALDPTAADAADLVTHLMLLPPSTAPVEVEAAIDAHDIGTARSQGRLAALSMFGYLALRAAVRVDRRARLARRDRDARVRGRELAAAARAGPRRAHPPARHLRERVHQRARARDGHADRGAVPVRAVARDRDVDRLRLASAVRPDHVRRGDHLCAGIADRRGRARSSRACCRRPTRSSTERSC